MFDDAFTTTNMDESDLSEIKNEPLDTPVLLPTVSPAYGADLDKDGKNSDLLTLDEQIKLRETCRTQAENIRRLKKEIYTKNTLGAYQPYKRGVKKREKKIFEASAPEDLEGARISSVGSEIGDDIDDDGEWM